MSKHAPERAPTATSGSTADDFLSLVGAQAKLADITRRIDDDFQKEVFVRARVVAGADPATLDIGSFVNSWTQVTQTLEKSQAAVASFNESLNTQIYTHPKEIEAAAKSKRDALQAELDKRLEGDEALEKEIAALDQLIAASQPKQTGTKTAAAMLSKKAAAKKAGTKGGKKRARRK
jgi:DNA topoisomerase IB